MNKTFALTAGAVLALAACSKSQDPAAVKTGPSVTEANDEPASAAPIPVTRSSATASPAVAAANSIPMAMRGRWGLVAADCTSTKGDAKGLMTIDATSIRFYESVARLAKIDQRSETALQAGWAYSGEGMDWKRDMTLALQGDGKVLTKQEFGEDAPAGAYRYMRCD